MSIEEKNLSSVLTEYFYVLGLNKDKSPKLKPGIKVLLSFAVRDGTQKIYLPNRTFNSISVSDLIKDIPELMKERIQIVDNNQAIYKRVEKYLNPVKNITENSNRTFNIDYIFVENLLYKLILGSEYKTQVDIGSPFSHLFNNYSLEDLSDIIKKEDEEAAFRVDLIQGIFNNYSPFQRSEIFTLSIERPDGFVYKNIEKFLNDSEIIEFSKNKFLFGIPSKSKIGLKYIKNNINKVDLSPYSWLKTGWEYMRINDISLSKIPDLLANVFIKKLSYNPPIINLNEFRERVCKVIYPNNPPNFVFADSIKFPKEPDPETNLFDIE